jgi:hypothetical protein
MALLAVNGLMLCTLVHGSAAPDPVAWITKAVAGNLKYVRKGLANKSAVPGLNSRDIPNAALSALLVSNGTDTTGAIDLLKKFGTGFGTSFGCQGLPPICLGYMDHFNSTDKAWLMAAVRKNMPKTQDAATPQEVSYTNMWLMSTIDSILLGEIAGGDDGAVSASVGYDMLNQWINYTNVAGIHEFTSPTYTYVQVSALYMGYIHAKKPGAREAIGRMLDLLWADIAANYFQPRAALSGAHSRDYDFLLGRGMLEIEMFAMQLPGFPPADDYHPCSYKDPHCEGTPEGTAVQHLRDLNARDLDSHYSRAAPSI